MRANDENGTRREAVLPLARLPAWEARFLADTRQCRRPPRPPAVLERNAIESADHPNFGAVNQAAPANMESARTPGPWMEAGVR